MKTVLISGSGSGMGLLTAKKLIEQGSAVYAGVRDPNGRSVERREALEKHAADVGGHVRVVDMDVHSEESCRAAVEQVIADRGQLDVVIHNAAHLYIGFAEAFTPEQLADSFNTNAIGAHRLNRAALPYMRQQGGGVLLYVGSTITQIVTPFLLPYITGKSALDALAEVTAYEVNPLGIETVILMPGLFPDGTSHFQSAVYSADEDVIGGYSAVQPDYDHLDRGLRNLLRGGEAPVRAVADEIARVLALPKGEKPFRPTVDFSDYGGEAVNSVVEAQTARVFRIMDMERLLKVS